MILGMSTATYTVLHVVLSLLGIVSGFVVIFGLIRNRRLDSWTSVFLASTVLTSITGFGFPFEHLLPAHKVGIVSLLVLAVTIPARYVFHLTGRWRSTYVVGAAIAHGAQIEPAADLGHARHRQRHAAAHGIPPGPAF